MSGHYFDRAGSLPTHLIHLGNGRASGYRAPYSGLEDRRVSLITYARYAEHGTTPGNGVPCEIRTRIRGFADHCLSYSANGT